MPLTASQLQTLKTDLAANTNTVVINGVATPINVVPHGAQNAQTIADWYNQTASPEFDVWQTAVPVASILDAVIWAHYTPADTPDGTVQWSNRSLACQGKQFNLEIMVQGRASFDASKPNLRGGLNDATTNLPAGTGGASVSGGWSSILPILHRAATNAEKLFAAQTTGVGVTSTDPLGATTNPALMTFEGNITGTDILNAWAA